MTEVSGRVESVTIKKTQTGKTMYTIKLNGEYFSGFNDPKCNRGDEIALEYKLSIDGKFKNYTGIELLEMAEPEEKDFRQATPETASSPEKVGLALVDDLITEANRLAGLLETGTTVSESEKLHARVEIFNQLMTDRRTQLIQSYKKGNMKEYRQ